MLHRATLTLMAGSGIEELIVPAIGVIIFVGSAIVNAMRKDRQKAQTRTPPPSPAEGQRKLDELAQRRRRQLQELARQQQGKPAQPDNLTVHQARKREQARLMYQRRAEALRQPQLSQPPQAQQPTPAPVLNEAAREALQQQDERRQHEEEQRQREQAQRRRQHLSAVQEQEELSLKQRQQQLAEAERSLEQREAVLGQRIRESRLIAAQQGLNPNPSDKRRHWRRAWMLKEILDQPVGLRDLDPPMAGR
ncbi:MAG: hypothetical protein IT440_14850 [Phycisphaeraceae bacterium]|nr:hypothetical protein [Phycisphaeraceae bacterium]